MTSRLLIAVVVLAASLLLHDARADDASAAKAALAAQSARFTAMVDADVDTLRGLLADELTYTHTTGWMETKAGFLKTVASGKIDYQEIDAREISVRVHEDTAIMTGLAEVVGAKDGRAAEFTIRFLEVARRTDDGWQLLAWQSVRLPKDGD